MSSGKSQYTHTTETVKTDLVRQRQEQARKAQRKRQQESAHKKFISVVKEIEQIDFRLEKAIRSSDKAGEMLPDYIAPVPPQRLLLKEMPSKDSAPENLLHLVDNARQKAERYQQSVSDYEISIEKNRLQGEEMLRRRKEMAKVWFELIETEQQTNEIIRALHELSYEKEIRLPKFPARTTDIADLKPLQGILSEWKEYKQMLQEILFNLQNREIVQQRLNKTAGKEVVANNAEMVLECFDQTLLALYRECLHNAYRKALAKLKVDIPESTSSFIDQMINLDQVLIFSEKQIERYVLRAGQQVEDATKAEQMMQDVPQFVESTPEGILESWQVHTEQLQRIAQCFEPLTPSVERTHSALHLKVKEHLQYELYKADLLARYGSDFIITEHNSELLALHKEKEVGYLIITELDEQGGLLSQWQMFKSGEGVLSSEDFQEVCSAWQVAANKPCEGINVTSEESEKGSSKTLKHKNVIKAESLKISL